MTGTAPAPGTPRRLFPGDPALAQVLDLVRACFAPMDGLVDPPSSVHLLTPEAVDRQAAEAEVWAIGTPPVACVFLTPRPGALYLGKLACAPEHRRSGLARRLVAQAERRARALGLAAVELQVRVELVANHAAFRAMGFSETGRTAHPGYDRPTSVTFRKTLGTAPRDSFSQTSQSTP